MAKQTGTRVTTKPGYIVVEIDGQSTQYSVAEFLRAADIPLLTHEKVREITSSVNLLFVLIRTLIAKGILNNEFLEEGEYDLEAIIQATEDMGGDYSMPDISVP